MHAKRPDVGSSLTTDPKDPKMTVVVELQQFDFMDGSDTELTLDGGYQRGTLEKGTSKGLKGPLDLLLGLHLIVKAENTDILLSGTLLGLDQTGGTIDTNNQTSSDLGIKGTAVSSFITSVVISARCARNKGAIEHPP